MQQDVVRFQRGIGFEFSTPVTIFMLDRKKMTTSTVHGRGYATKKVVDFSANKLCGALTCARGEVVHILKQWPHLLQILVQPEWPAQSPAEVRNGHSQA